MSTKTAVIFKNKKEMAKFPWEHDSHKVMAEGGHTIMNIEPGTGNVEVFMVEMSGRTKKERQRNTFAQLNGLGVGEWTGTEVLVLK
jgi:hypothetical protein